MEKYLYKRKNHYIIYVLICLSVVLIESCITGPAYNPGPAEIIFENRSLTELKKGSVDFVGFQIYNYGRSYNGHSLFQGNTIHMQLADLPVDYSHYISFPVPDQKNILSLFIKSLDNSTQKKIHKFVSNSFFFREGKSAYRQMQMLYYNSIPVYDEWDINIVNAGGPGRLDNYCLKYLKKNSDADYYFIVSIRPLEIQLPDKQNQYSTMKVALLIVLYNNMGEKIYSKIYTEKLEGIKDPRKENIYYNCSRKLIENYGAQINRDLSFLLIVDDAKVPTLKDLLKEVTEKRDKK